MMMQNIQDNDVQVKGIVENAVLVTRQEILANMTKNEGDIGKFKNVVDQKEE